MARHLRLPASRSRAYASLPRNVSGRQRTSRADPASHGGRLRGDLVAAGEAFDSFVVEAPEEAPIDGIPLEFVGGLEQELELVGLDTRDHLLLNVRQEGDTAIATVLVPDGRLPNLLAKIDEYLSDQRTSKRGRRFNAPLLEGIERIRSAVWTAFWTDAEELRPRNTAEVIDLEVWLRRIEPASRQPPALSTSAAGSPAVERFRAAATAAGIAVNSRVTRFPERDVVLVRGSVDQLVGSFTLLGCVAELRRARTLNTPVLSRPPHEQGLLVSALAERTTPAPPGSPAVCLVDTGVSRGHGLLEAHLAEADCHRVEPSWPAADEHGHGTAMAGVALYGSNLGRKLAATDEPLLLEHGLESGKLIRGGHDQSHAPEDYAAVTLDLAAQVEAAAPARPRVFSIALTAPDGVRGQPSLWSSGIDQHASGALDGVRRLYCVSAGNLIPGGDGPPYPEANFGEESVQDPAQAMNAVTVGACTDLRDVGDPDYEEHEVIAPAGGLSPSSRTSVAWANTHHPWKPDLVMEGGNYQIGPLGPHPDCDDLRLLTTSGGLGALAPLTTTGDTSAAVTSAARLAARLMARCPEYRPETVRGLMVHGAEWTPEMLRQFPPTDGEGRRKLLSCYGHGVPSLDRSAETAASRVVLIAESDLQPYRLEKSEPRMNELRLFDLPWPRAVLEDLGANDVTLRLTLSYFAEPSPGRRGEINKYRYASHGLRFKLREPGESEDVFVKRVSKASWSDVEAEPGSAIRPNTADSRSGKWQIGPEQRVRGTIHRDQWTGSASDVASSHQIAVYPVGGWWYTRPQLRCVERRARFSLVVSIASEGVDLLTPISNVLSTPIAT